MEDEEKLKSEESSDDRRTFMRVAAAAGLFAAAAMSPEPGQAQTTQATSAEDPQAPPGLKGTPDLRYPLCYETPTIEGVRVLTQYFAALSRRDARSMADNMHFPFGSFEGTEPVSVKTPEELLSKAPPSMNLNPNPERFTDHDSYMKAGCYDVFGGLEVFNSDPVSVNMALTYDRFGPDGKKLLRCEGVYCATNNDGRWALQLASTIFTPADLIGVRYPDAEQAAKRLRIDHDLQFVTRDSSFNATTNQLGTSMGLGGGGTPTGNAPTMSPRGLKHSQTFVRMHRPGGVMSLFRVKGVKSRLNIHEVTEADLKRDAEPIDYEEYRDTFKGLGVGPWGWVFGVVPAERIIHQTVNKVHFITGATRYTATGEVINTDAQVAIATYRKSRWGLSGGLSYVMTLDRGNDRPEDRERA
jgi:hypothetical protein